MGVDTITLPSSYTKTLRGRVILIIHALRPWLVHFPIEVSANGLKSDWRRARVKARMENVNFHDQRHSRANIMLGLDIDLYAIRKILGNSKVQTTQRYAHLQVDGERAAMDKLSVLVQNKK
jgi:integrase